MSPEQIKILEEAKRQGLTKEQAMAKVFMPIIQPKDVGRFAGSGSDIKDAGKSLWADFRGRASNIREGFAAGGRGEQTPIETGAQMAGNIIGGIGDTAFRGIQAVTTPFMKESEEEAIATGVSKAVEATGIPQAISETSARTQRNIFGGLGFLEGLTVGVGSTATKPVTKGIKDTIQRLTAEQITSNYTNRLRNQINNPNLPPKAKEELANASLNFKEKMIGLRPDEKKRLQEMGEAKITEYLDATHLRNISDTPIPNSPLPANVWGPQELGNHYVQQAFDKLSEVMNNTGSEIGRTRTKLASVKLQQPQVDTISNAFDQQIAKLGLGIKNGKIVELPNKISPTKGSDINAIQSLYDDFLKFKQSPTIENAYALRTNFDAKIKFGQSAREVSNAVDPLSKSIRSSIAEQSAKVIGKESADELKKYSEFMDAFGDLKSFTDRSAGSEYLLRLVLSGRGREARDLVETIKTHTGVDLMDDATAMKIAVARFANENQQNMFKQEVTRAGFDVVALFQGNPTGLIDMGLRKLREAAIDEEKVIKNTANLLE